MPKKPKVDIINQEPKITVTRSMLNKGKIAKKDHAFFVVSFYDMKNNNRLTLTQQINTKDMSPISELATKGRLIEEFKEHFKL